MAAKTVFLMFLGINAQIRGQLPQAPVDMHLLGSSPNRGPGAEPLVMEVPDVESLSSFGGLM